MAQRTVCDPPTIQPPEKVLSPVISPRRYRSYFVGNPHCVKASCNNLVAVAVLCRVSHGRGMRALKQLGIQRFRVQMAGNRTFCARCDGLVDRG
jgi:hypothetical protein